MRREADILVVGTGPTGLALALQAHRHGAQVRIVERRAEAFRPSRALILHPRTLEVLRPLGVTDALLARADVAPQARLHLGARVARVHLDELSLPDTAFPHLTLVRQMDVETPSLHGGSPRSASRSRHRVDRGKRGRRQRSDDSSLRIRARADRVRIRGRL